MNILKPYIGIVYNDPNNIVNEYNKQIEELKELKNKAILEYHLSVFKNFKFRKEFINRYKENITDLCCDILMINNIKQVYERDSRLSILEVGKEGYDYARNEYSYAKGYTQEFDSILDDIVSISDDMYGDNCYSDMCMFGYFNLNGSYYNLIDTEFEYDEDYRGEYVYYIDKYFYPIVLEIEKLINSNSKEFIQLIKEYDEDIF